MATYYDTSSEVWGTWTSSTSASVTTCGNGTWAQWTQADYTTTSNCTSTASTVWIRWASDATPNASYQPPKPPKLSAEEQARLLEEARRQEEAWKKKAEEERLLREAAERRAEELLQQYLNDQQRRQYAKEKKFLVLAGDGATFELEHKWSGNAREFDSKGRPIQRLCIHPKDSVPIPDHLLAQKLMLETNPAEFRRIANKTPIHAG